MVLVVADRRRRRCADQARLRPRQARAGARQRNLGHARALAPGERAGRRRARQGGRGDRRPVRGRAGSRVLADAVAPGAAELRLRLHAAARAHRPAHPHQDAARGDVAGAGLRHRQAQADAAAGRGARVHPHRRRQVGVPHPPSRRHGARHPRGRPGIRSRGRRHEAAGGGAGGATFTGVGRAGAVPAAGGAACATSGRAASRRSRRADRR